MKFRKLMRKRCFYSIPVATAALAACTSANANTVNQLINGGTTQQLDDPTNWSTGVVPTSASDVLVAAPYPPAAMNLTFSLGSSTNASGNVTWGSYNDVDNTGYFNYIIGSTLNTSSYVLNIGAGTNSYSPVSSDLIYTTASSDTVFRSGNTSYGTLSVNFLQSGNIDTAGLTESTAAFNGASGIVLTKTGTNALELLNANQTFKGTWNLSAGTLQITGGAGLGVAQTGVPELTFTGSGILQFSTGANGVGSTRTLAINAGVTATFDTNGFNVSVGSPIVNGTNGSGGSLLKINTGTLIMTGSSNYSGNTTVTGGVLQYNASNTYAGNTFVNNNATLALGANGSLPATTTLNLGGGTALGGGTFNILPLYNITAGAVVGTNLLSGSSNISAPSFNVASASYSLGTINRSTGSTVDFTPPTGLTGSLGSLLTKTANVNYSGGQPTIMAGWATANGQTTWAVSAATANASGAVSALSTFDQTLAVSGADADVVSTSALTTPVAVVNSLRFNTPGGFTLTPNPSLTIATGGILQTANVGSSYNNISGGTLTAASGELIVTQADTNAFLNILSQIVDNGTPVGLTKSGAGGLFLSGSNTYTGPTAVTAGTLSLNNQYAIQYSTLTQGSVAFIAGITNFNVGGIGTSSNIALQDNASNAINLIIGGNNASTTFNGIFTGAGSLVKVGTGTTYLANGNSTFTGGMNIAQGTIAFIAGGSFGAVGNVVTINAGAGISYNGSGAATFGTTRGFTLGGGNDTIQIGSINTATNTSTSALIIGASNYSGGILAGPSSGTATLVKNGLGSLTIYTNSTYNGGTTVLEGTLSAYTSNGLGVSTLGNGYTGAGPLVIAPTAPLFATVNIESVAPQIASLSSTYNGNLSTGTSTLTLGFPAANASTALTVGADGTSTTFSGNIGDLSANYSGAVGSIIKVGTGTLTLSGKNTYAGGTNVTAGSIVFASANAFPANTSLTIAPGATVSLSNHSGSASYVPLVGLLNNNGTIDITSNAMVVHNSSIGAINQQVATAYNNGNWNGTNGSIGVITSSTAAADSTHLTAVGLATGFTSFQNMNVSSSDVLAKFTYYGDANLDGKIDGTDYSRIDNAVAMGGLTGWYNGDFNYDGVINGSDYTLIDNAFNSQGAQLSSEIASPTAQIAVGASAVPEPSVIGMLAAGAMGFLGRRRRRI